MTKNQFQKICIDLGCTAHYQGHTKTMFVFGPTESLIKIGKGGFRSGHRYTPEWLNFGVTLQATH